DSANVAVSAAALSSGPVLSAGLIVAGPERRDQEIRRQLIVDHVGLRELTVPTTDHLPLSPDSPRTASRTHYPDTDVYLEAFDALRGRLRDAGARVVLTGYGGDEIMSRAPAERSRRTTSPRVPPWLDQHARDALSNVDTDCSPITMVTLPTLVVFAARHPAYLRAGLWPIAHSPHRNCPVSGVPSPSSGASERSCFASGSPASVCRPSSPTHDVPNPS